MLVEPVPFACKARINLGRALRCCSPRHVPTSAVAPQGIAAPAAGSAASLSLSPTAAQGIFTAAAIALGPLSTCRAAAQACSHA
jgi:hypothetical protein